MKKSLFIIIAISAMLLTSCMSKSARNIVEAYEDATSQLDKANSDSDCDRINEDLIKTLQNIVDDAPEISKSGKIAFRGSEIAKMDEAFKAYWKKLEEKASSTHVMFMPIPDLSNAMRQAGKFPQSSGGWWSY